MATRLADLRFAGSAHASVIKLNRYSEGEVVDNDEDASRLERRAREQFGALPAGTEKEQETYESGCWCKGPRLRVRASL